MGEDGRCPVACCDALGLRDRQFSAIKSKAGASERRVASKNLTAFFTCDQPMAELLDYSALRVVEQSK